jgi:hypothetical protein
MFIIAFGVNGLHRHRGRRHRPTTRPLSTAAVIPGAACSVAGNLPWTSCRWSATTQFNTACTAAAFRFASADWTVGNGRRSSWRHPWRVK